MALLSEDEKHALRQKQGLLYSSGQFPLVGGGKGGGSRRPRKRMSPLKALVTGVVIVLITIVGLVALLTSSARAEPLSLQSSSLQSPSSQSPSSQIGVAALVAPEHDGERAHAQQ